MAKVLTKSQIIQAIADAHKDKLARKDVARVLESLSAVGYKELKKNGIFTMPRTFPLSTGFTVPPTSRNTSSPPHSPRSAPSSWPPNAART